MTSHTDEIGNIIKQVSHKSKKCDECGISIIGNPWYQLVIEKGIKFSAPVCNECVKESQVVEKSFD